MKKDYIYYIIFGVQMLLGIIGIVLRVIFKNNEEASRTINDNLSRILTIIIPPACWILLALVNYETNFKLLWNYSNGNVNMYMVGSYILFILLCITTLYSEDSVVDKAHLILLGIILLQLRFFIINKSFYDKKR
jgi:hypothetical protein